jgi:hypothetical protein
MRRLAKEGESKAPTGIWLTKGGEEVREVGYSS